jgi:RNA-directed DNA polymerase
MSQLASLKATKSLSDVAWLLQVKPGMLSFLLYKKPEALRYSKFEIPKRSGGSREIWAPSKELKLIQHRLSTLLQDCVDEIDASHGRSADHGRPGVSHGFERKRTTMTNARAHVTRRHVFNVDLQDFFGTINFGRVRGFFIKDKNFALPVGAGRILTSK